MFGNRKRGDKMEIKQYDRAIGFMTTPRNWNWVSISLLRYLKEQKQSYHKKWHKAMAKFESLASLDLHIEEIKGQKPEGEVKVGKSDTEHILIVTKALIKYAEELLKEGG